MKKPILKKGNCFIYMILFKIQNPAAKIEVRWNKRSRVVSFSALLGHKRIFYKMKDRTQSKYFFNGKVVVIDTRPSMYDLQEKDLRNIEERGYSNNG